MPKKSKTKKAPRDYFDMKDSVEKSKKVKHSEVFGKQSIPKVKKTAKKPPKKTKKNNAKKKSPY